MGKKKISGNKVLKTAMMLSLEPSMHATLAYEKNQSSKEKAAQSAEDAANAAAKTQADQQAQIDALKEAEAQQDTVRKKLAALGRVQAGTAFNDAAGTAQTKVFS